MNRKQATRTTFCLLALVAVLVSLTVGASAQQAPPASGAPSIESLLREDGTLDPSRAADGSFDASGYRMYTDPDGTPHFVRSEVASVGTIPEDDLWDSRFGPSGTNGIVYALAVHGTDLYLGGDFTIAGTTLANNVVKWSTTEQKWEVLGDENANGVGGPVYAMAVYGNNLYVGGYFESAGYARASGIARWEITRKRWTSLGGGVAHVDNTVIYSGWVYAIAADSANVFVGGQFIMADADSVYNLARWDIASQTWSAACKADENRTNGTVRALAIHQGSLYIGGDFTLVADIVASRIARWDLRSNTWHPLEAGLDGDVRSLVVSGGRLYAGGYFTHSGSTTLQHVAVWTGSTWNPLGVGLDGAVLTLAPSDGSVYAGGLFTASGTVSANMVARWDGGAWLPLGTGVADTITPAVQGLAVIGNKLFAGGKFTTAGAAPAYNAAQWDTVWSALGAASRPVLNGTDGTVQAIAIDRDDVYVGGDFNTAGGVAAPHVARWTRSTGLWSALGTGITGDGAFVRALAVAGNGDLYVGGIFSAAGGIPTRGIARWNGSRWLSLRQGVEGLTPYVFALAVRGTDLFVGGAFSGASGVVSPKVIRWGMTDSAWHPVGGGIVGDTTYTYVAALAADETDLYAGGEFTKIGALRAERIARWNGSNWSAVGAPGAPGLNAPASALAIDGTRLYVGGEFTRAGGVPARFLAMWNGTDWTQLDSTLNGPVRGLAINGRRMIVGGQATQAVPGGLRRVSVVDLDTRVFTELSPVNGIVNAVAAIDSEYYAGGAFSAAGDARCANIAQWRDGGWSSMGSDPSIGVAGPIFALALKGAEVYVGGMFRTTGGLRTNGIARWSDDRWMTVGSGVRGGPQTVRALLVAPAGEVYAGGSFHVAGSDSAWNLARWDGTRWRSVGGGVQSTIGRVASVNALALDGSWLYVGGVFDRAGTIQAQNIARVNLANGTWESLGSGVRSLPVPSWAPTVYALGISGGRIFVGGRFDTAGSVPSRNMAIWDAGGWTVAPVSLTDTLIANVHAIAVNGADVVASTAYRFIVARDVISGHKLYRWRSERFEAIDSGGGPIYSLEYDSRGRLYVGGSFGFIGKINGQSIAMFDGTVWKALGTGILGLDFSGRFTLGTVYAMQPDGTNLWVGGDFTIAGRKPSYYFARWSGGAGLINGAKEEQAAGTGMSLSCIPNPASEHVEILLDLNRASLIDLEIFDARGELMARVGSAELAAGRHGLSLDVSDLPAGIYLVHARTERGALSQRLLIAR